MIDELFLTKYCQRHQTCETKKRVLFGFWNMRGHWAFEWMGFPMSHEWWGFLKKKFWDIYWFVQNCGRKTRERKFGKGTHCTVSCCYLTHSSIKWKNFRYDAFNLVLTPFLQQHTKVDFSEKYILVYFFDFLNSWNCSSMFHWVSTSTHIRNIRVTIVILE